MTNPAPTPEHAPATPPSPDGKACINCGYSLNGLSREGLCPECGTAVNFSLRPDRLVFAGLDWLRRVHQGLVLIEAAIVFLIMRKIVAVGLGLLTASPASLLWFETITAIVSTAIELWGWWLASTPDPAKGNDTPTSTAAAWLRPLAPFRAAFALFALLIPHFPGSGISVAKNLFDALSEFAFVALVTGAASFLETLAVRAPLPPLQKTIRLTQALTWIIVVRAGVSLISAIIALALPSGMPMLHFGFSCVLVPLSVGWQVWAIAYTLSIDGTRTMLTRIVSHRKQIARNTQQQPEIDIEEA